MTTQHEIDQSGELHAEHARLTQAEFRIAALLAERDAMRALIAEFVDHFKGNKQAELGNGVAYKWCDKARLALKIGEGT